MLRIKSFATLFWHLPHFICHKICYLNKLQLLSIYNKPVSQSCAVAKRKNILTGHWTIKLAKETAGPNKSFQTLFFVRRQLHLDQWSSLPFCLPSLIVQWPARIFHFYLLRMIVNWLIRTGSKGSCTSKSAQALYLECDHFLSVFSLSVSVQITP